MYFLLDSNSPLTDHLIFFYYLVMILIMLILFSTLYIMISIIANTFINRFLLKNHTIEIIWTIIPMFLLILIAIPSLKALYYIDELWNPIYFTIKIMGHQWYWSYEYSEFYWIQFDSYMINELDKLDLFRLLDTDNHLVVPMNVPIRIIVTSMDVIHSWTIPSIGIKMDAVPGRINQMTMFTIRPGIYFGQCSEICGVNHSFMPITLESTNCYNFLKWVKNF
uniref:Cytochrome c oxidase subunit 2 n=1 Tax=Rediviva intermixta TaxID=1688786 RepID=A0A172CHQ8_9HYME|nr:cytochrome c oxidase subunit II [Rediviva intermixta]AKS40057.1 cytochrome c oxidase subunit II [Rediviva intermixta]